MIMYLSFRTNEDRDKFEYIYNKYKRLMLYKANEILRDRNLAEDSANEAFIRIYKNLHKIDNPDSNRTVSFLVTIVKNTSLTLLGKEKFHTFEGIPENSVDDFNLEDSVLSKMASMDIYKFLDYLDEESKSIFLLKFAHDLSHKEIGKMLKLTENNVTTKLHRAKKKLAKLMNMEV